MKLIDQIRRQPLFVSFGRSSSDSGFVNVELAAVRAASTITITAADGSAAPIAAADTLNAGVMSATDKAKLDSLAAGGGETPSTEFASRAVVPAANIDPAVTHLRTAGYTAAGDGGAAAYKRVGAQPIHSLWVQSADLAFWELVPDSTGYINVRQAGAVGDDATDDGQAFLDALAFASLNANVNDNATFGVIVPPGNFYLGATTLELKRTVHLVGQGAGLAGAKPAKLRWDANVTGIVVHRHNTTGATTEADPNALSADGSKIEGLWLESAGGTIAGVTDATKGHGVWLRARAVLRDLTIAGFPGNGINIVATAGGGGAIEGNANNWVIDGARITGCHMSGVFVDGADVNAGSGSRIDVSSNGRWGIFDSSFLGNTWVACHAATNGVALIGENGAGQSSFVHLGGNRYAANADATPAQLVATQPGTNEAVWIFSEVGAVHPNIPDWLAAQPEGTYFAGGSYRTDNANARNTLAGCYQESGQAPAQLVTPTTVIGGLINGFKGTASGLVDGVLRGIVRAHNHLLYAPTRDLSLEVNPAVAHLLKLKAGGDHVSGLNLAAWDEATGHWLIGEHANSAARRPIRITTDLNTQTYGRAAPLAGGELSLQKGAWIGNGGNTRWFKGFDAKPASGTFGRGDKVWNFNPIVPGDPAGWRITTAGAIGSGAVMEEFFYLPDLPANRGKLARPHTVSNRVEWRDAPKAGGATIANTASTQAVAFTTAFGSANYAVALSADGDERVWVTAKTAAGFTLNRAGTAGARAVDWTATPHENL